MQYLGQLKPWRRTRDVFLKHISFYQLQLWNSYRATRTTSPHDTYLFIYQKWYSFVSVTIWIHPTTPARSFFLLQHVKLQIHAMITARHLLSKLDTLTLCINNDVFLLSLAMLGSTMRIPTTWGACSCTTFSLYSSTNIFDSLCRDTNIYTSFSGW